jgi:DeoR/GlpR family transcriptional regulator of sugar metabolism
MDAKAGFTCPNLMEAETDRALIEAGRRLVVVADHSKWGLVGIASIARLDQADVLATDSGMPPEVLAILEEAVPEVIVAQVPPEVPADELASGSARSREVVARAH